VVALLPRLLELDIDIDEGVGESGQAPPLPSPNLRDRILETARVEGRPAVEPETADEPAPRRIESPFAPQEPIVFPPPRADSRGRGGTGTGSGMAPATPWETMGRFGSGWLAAAVLAIVAVGAVIWALSLQSTIDDKDQQLADKDRQIADFRRQANASAWHLVPGSSDQANQSGTLLYSLPDQTGALVVQDMPELPPDQVYQSWLIKGNNAPVPGPTFTVDDTGTGSVPIVGADTPSYNVVAVTKEPQGGSTAPTMPILLQGQLTGAAGALPGLGIAAVHLAPPDAERSD
jgi:anti-sigma-K factor RskA